MFFCLRFEKMCLYFDSLDRYSLVHKDNAAVILISDWISLFDLVRNMLSLILIMLSKLGNFMTPQFCTIKAELTYWRVSNFIVLKNTWIPLFEIHLYKTVEYTVRNQSMAGIRFPLVCFDLQQIWDSFTQLDSLFELFLSELPPFPFLMTSFHSSDMT